MVRNAGGGSMQRALRHERTVDDARKQRPPADVLEMAKQYAQGKSGQGEEDDERSAHGQGKAADHSHRVAETGLHQEMASIGAAQVEGAGRVWVPQVMQRVGSELHGDGTDKDGHGAPRLDGTGKPDGDGDAKSRRKDGAQDEVQSLGGHGLRQAHEAVAALKPVGDGKVAVAFGRRMGLGAGKVDEGFDEACEIGIRQVCLQEDAGLAGPGGFDAGGQAVAAQVRIHLLSKEGNRALGTAAQMAHQRPERAGPQRDVVVGGLTEGLLAPECGHLGQAVGQRPSLDEGVRVAGQGGDFGMPPGEVRPQDRAHQSPFHGRDHGRLRINPYRRTQLARGCMLDRLEALGLNAYEARALAHLLKHGERTAPDLSRETAIPFGRVYDTLNHLVERGLAVSRAGRPRMFVAVAPGTVSSRLLAASKRKLQEEERQMSQQAAALDAQLARLEPQATPGSTLYGVRLGEDAAREFLIEATHGARERVEAYLAFDKVQDDDLALFDAFRQAVARGVHTRILLRAKDVDYLLSTPYVNQVLDALIPFLGESLQVRLSGADITPFSVLDSERVVLGVRNPLDPKTYFAVVHLDDRAFAKDLVGKFDTLWREGELDAQMVKRLLGTRSGRAIAKLGVRLKRKRSG